MQATLAFQFPPTRQSAATEVSVDLLIPFPEHRPRTVTNFVYMCTGELPPADFLPSLWKASPQHIREESAMPIGVQYPSSDAAVSDGLLPFARTAVAHLDLDGLGVMEIGSSTTKTIFGGFIPDEPLHDAALPTGTAAYAQRRTVEQMRQLKQGTLLCGSVAGTPHTQGSRYYLVMRDITDPAQAAELAAFFPLGLASPPEAMSKLLSSAQSVPVQPRTLAPLKKIELAGCTLRLDYNALLQSSASSVARGIIQRVAARGTASNTAAAIPRIAGRTRGREEEEDDDEEQHHHMEGEDAGQHGFFQFNARFPTSISGSGALLGSATKRRRLETAVEDVSTLNTAIDAREGEAFDFFKAQAYAFNNDLTEIKEKQNFRLQRKMRRASKAKALLAGDSKKGRAAQKNTGSAAAGGGVLRTKRLKKRY